MSEPAFFEVVDASGITVYFGEVFLFGGENTEIIVSGYGEFTLLLFSNVDEFVVTTLCEEPIATEEPTPESPLLDVNGECRYGDSPTWVVTNNGGNMSEPAFFEVVDGSGITVDFGEVFLYGGESTEISIGGYGEFTLLLFSNVDEFVVTTLCEEPIATEEPTPESPLLDVTGECRYGDLPTWTISNSGGDMLYASLYEVFDANFGIIDSSEILLLAGESIEVSVNGYGEFTLVINGGEHVVYAFCEEPIATEEPTPEPTELPPLGCQKKNQERLDCSSLEVTGYCDGSVAVFTITNTGESGDGDMRQSTEYRIVVDGETVESGAIQIDGGTTMEVRYEGDGRVTLYADQQIGHPGKSRPQTTLSCS